MIKTDIFIGICYHKQAAIIQTETLRPIHVGAALSESKLDFAIPDNTGVNISKKNRKWCELTAAYWMRQNVDADYYGLMHYRRLLNFSAKVKMDRSFVSADDYDHQKFSWDDRIIRNRVATNDLIIPSTYRVHPAGLPENILTNYDMYARDHYSNDMDICLEICREADPDIFPYFLQTIKDTHMRFGNIFVMKRDLYFEYTDWMFPVLEEVENKIDTSNYDTYQSRVIGFLAERLTEAYFRYAQSVRGARVEERSIAFAAKPPHSAQLARAKSEAIAKTSRQKTKRRVNSDPVNIAFAIDEGYAGHAAAALHSILLHANTPERFHSYIFHKGDLRPDSCKKIELVANNFGSQVSFVEISVDSLRWLPMNRPHISLTTYYRLIMDKYLPGSVSRIIYLDADTLATAPLEELWETDMEDRVLAAAPDEGGILQSRRLRLSNQHKYFNAGVLVLDINKIRSMDLKAAVLNAYETSGEYITLQDQDLLNLIFENATTPLDLRWNVNNRIFVKNELEPSYTDDQAKAAAENPGILHFTDRRKPWQTKSYNPYYELYWYHRNQTPWAETSVDKFSRRLRRMLWSRLNSRYRRNTASITNTDV